MLIPLLAFRVSDGTVCIMLKRMAHRRCVGTAVILNLKN